MSLSWTGPAVVLAERADGAWAGIWSLGYAAGLAAANLAALPGADEDLLLTYAAFDLNQALSELEAVHPEVLSTAAAVDLGTVHDGGDTAGAVAVVTALVGAAIHRVSALAATPGLPVADVLCLGRVQPLLLTAREKVTGGPW